MAKKIIKLNEKDIIKITGDVINELQHKDLGDKEALYEMALIGPMTNVLEVFVNTNDGGYIPHFHIWDSSTRGSEFHTCIRYDCPEYFHHSGKEDTLNSREKKWRIGQIAWCFDSTLCLWVKLRGEISCILFAINSSFLYLCAAARSVAELCWGATSRGIGLRKRQA